MNPTRESDMKFRKKPVVIEAVQITDEWFDGDHPNPLHPKDRRLVFRPDSRIVTVQTLEGAMDGHVGDWIITGIKGEVYPCRDDIFRLTYEPCDDGEIFPVLVI